MTNAAREGGRQASTGTKSQAQVRQAVLDYLARGGLPTGNVAVDLQNLTSASRSDPRQADQLDHMQITVTIPFSDVRWVVLDWAVKIQTITGMADWYSMRDLPLEVPTDIPIE
jgi:hypothetical protein